MALIANYCWGGGSICIPIKYKNQKIVYARTGIVSNADIMYIIVANLFFNSFKYKYKEKPTNSDSANEHIESTK